MTVGLVAVAFHGSSSGFVFFSTGLSLVCLEMAWWLVGCGVFPPSGVDFSVQMLAALELIDCDLALRCRDGLFLGCLVSSMLESLNSGGLCHMVLMTFGSLVLGILMLVGVSWCNLAVFSPLHRKIKVEAESYSSILKYITIDALIPR